MQAAGPQTAAQLAAAVRASQPRISTALATVRDAVEPIGAARRTRYALRRQVRINGNRWPVYRIDENGRASEFARVEAFYGGWRVRWAGDRPQWAHLVSDVDDWWEGFPFFLSDLRAQGFLGRLVARRLAESLRLPADPTNWSDDDTLVYLLSEGSDLHGNLVVGDDALRRALTLTHEPIVAESERPQAYIDITERLMQGALPGSSAGGEQPKFMTWVRRPSDGAQISGVMVKFSPPISTPVGRRWADLLACEARALNLLAEVGESQPGALILDAGDRRFLEVARFDRIGSGGRRGISSLSSWHGAVSFGDAVTWADAAEQFAMRDLIASTTLASIRRRQFFGELIGNSDMHFGNLSFWSTDTLPLAVTPAYDVLPMLWAPVLHGEIVPRVLAPLAPTPAQREDWLIAAGWAERFWREVSADELVSEEFRAIARSSYAIGVALRQRVV
jgi:hypothetical protein